MTVPFPTSYWVVPGKLLAGEHPTDGSIDCTHARLSALLDCGIRTFIDLTEPDELPSYHQLLRVLSDARELEVDHRRMPMRDRRAPADARIIEVLDVIDSSVREGKPVFIHCFAGIGRTGTVVGCYLQRHGLAARTTVMSCIAELRSAMPEAEAQGPSPHTKDQVALVERWAGGA